VSKKEGMKGGFNVPMRGRTCKAQLKGTIKKKGRRREDDEGKERKGEERKGVALLPLSKKNESIGFLLPPRACAEKNKRKPPFPRTTPPPFFVARS
jgi:hypothetical protein